jgi:signal transduction histidine kinase
MRVTTEPMGDGQSLKEAGSGTSPFFGDSEMSRRCRAFDWSTTPLGPVSGWSQALRTTVSTMLESRHPMFLWWGPELVQIYNDGYLPSFGTSGRDIAALGACGHEHWAEIWPIIGPQIEGVMTRAEATWHENDLVPIERNGHLEEVWWTYGYSPVRDDDGSVGGVLVVVQETTAHVLAVAERELLLAAERNARAEVDEARTAAESANLAKSEFLAVMSHELRTPLNAIGGYAELIQLGIHGPVTIQQAKALARIQESQRHLLGLINGVLNYSRVEAGHVSYALAEVSLDEVLSTCEGLIEPQVRGKQLALHYASNVCLNARADREKVEQIVLNLLSNAVKFTEPGGSITVDCGTVDERTVAIRVTDTGHGIPADKLDLVFQPFVQIDSKLTRTQEGTGLGLAISRDLARGMGGDLTAVSTLDAGSTFTVTLPAA